MRIAIFSDIIQTSGERMDNQTLSGKEHIKQIASKLEQS